MSRLYFLNDVIPYLFLDGEAFFLRASGDGYHLLHGPFHLTVKT